MKKILNTTTFIIALFVSLMLPVNQVSATGGQECRDVVDAYGNIRRICDTGLIFGEETIANLPVEVVMAVGGIFGFGALMTVNGKLMKAKLDK